MSINPLTYGNIFYAPYDYLITEDQKYPTYFHKLKYKIQATKESIEYLEERINNPQIPEIAKIHSYHPVLERTKRSLKAFEKQGSYLTSA